MDLGHPDTALQEAQRGLEVAESIDEKGTKMWNLLALRALARGKNGDIAGQIDDCRHVLDLQKAAAPLAPDVLYYPDALACLGEAELSRGKTDAAISYLAQSVALEHRERPDDLPAARFALARALRAAGRQPEQADELARKALDVLRPLPGRQRKVAAIERWLQHEDATPGRGSR
jgi:tetratricopeptide (TPR) repeat protein